MKGDRYRQTAFDSVAAAGEETSDAADCVGGRRCKEQQGDDGFRLNTELPAVNRGSGNGTDEAAVEDKTALKDGGKAVGLGEGNNGFRIQKQIENFPAGNESESGVNRGVNGVVFVDAEFFCGNDDDGCPGEQSEKNPQ